MSPESATRWHRRRWVRIALAGAVVLAGTFALGPRERFEERWTPATRDTDLAGLATWIARREAGVPGVRSGDQAEIVWADPDDPSRTEVSIVYLHGFSADRHEVEPLVSMLADSLDANVFFTRLRGHGRDSGAMAEPTVEDWLDDTAEAAEIGGEIGERVVLVGTSTGATLAAWAATRPEADGLAAAVLISPNFHPADRTSRVLLLPWGGLISRLVVGPQRCFRPDNAAQEAHWTTCYPTEALLPMMALVEHVRALDYGSLRAPTMVVYSPADRVVDPTETERVVAGMGGAEIEVVRYEASDDRGQHVLAGEVLSPGSTNDVAARILEFLRPVARASGAPR